MGVLITSLLLGIPMAYVLRCLLLEEKDGHEGPFKSSTEWVFFPGCEDQDGTAVAPHRQRVALFDRIRRVFGVYQVQDNIWTVQSDKAERFTCPHCLSFWCAFLFAIPYAFSLPTTEEAIAWYIPIHLSIAISAQIIHKYLETEYGSVH